MALIIWYGLRHLEHPTGQTTLKFVYLWFIYSSFHIFHRPPLLLIQLIIYALSYDVVLMSLKCRICYHLRKINPYCYSWASIFGLVLWNFWVGFVGFWKREKLQISFVQRWSLSDGYCQDSIWIYMGRLGLPRWGERGIILHGNHKYSKVIYVQKLC